MTKTKSQKARALAARKGGNPQSGRTGKAKKKRVKAVYREGTSKARTLIPLRFKAADASVRMLATAMGLPSTTGALRFPTVDAPRTAAMQAMDQRTVTVFNGAATNWANGDLLVAFFGQPGRLAMVYAVMNNPSYYTMLFAGPGVASDTWTLYPNAINGSVEPNESWPLVATMPQGNGGASVHGKSMAVGLSGNDPYLWLNTNDVFTFVSSAIGGGGASTLVGNVTFEIYRWTGQQANTLIQSIPVTLVAGLIPVNYNLFVASVPGYYRVAVQGFYITAGATTNAFNVTMRISGVATSGWTQISMGDLDANSNGDPVIGEEVRVNACSMLLSNTTSVLNRQGTVLAARIKSSDFLSMSPAILARMSEKYTGDAALGLYTFKEFSNYSEDFRNCVVNDTAKGLIFDLDFDDYYHFVQITCPNAATAANTFTASFSTILEFKTDVARYQKGVSHLSYDHLIRARQLINDKPEWFYENPIHASDIYNFIKTAVKGAGRAAGYVAPYAAKAAGALHPEGAAGYEMLAQLMRKAFV